MGDGSQVGPRAVLGHVRVVADGPGTLLLGRLDHGGRVGVVGDDVGALRALFGRVPLANDRPTAVICHTVKGKGIGFAENDPNWHHKSKIPDQMASDLFAALG